MFMFVNVDVAQLIVYERKFIDLLGDIDLFTVESVKMIPSIVLIPTASIVEVPKMTFQVFRKAPDLIVELATPEPAVYVNAIGARGAVIGTNTPCTFGGAVGENFLSKVKMSKRTSRLYVTHNIPAGSSGVIRLVMDIRPVTGSQLTDLLIAEA
jgi:hypothetical protein